MSDAYDAILFDCDGVIVETPSRETIVEAVARAADRLGVACSPEQTALEVLRGNLPAIGRRCASMGVDREAFCSRAAAEFVRAQRRELEAGLRSPYSDVDALADLSAPLGVVSDNLPRFLSAVLSRVDLAGRFETVRGCSFTPRGFERRKPNPHNLRAAMADLEASNAIYVGDRPVDVRAAVNAGIDSALLRRDGDSSPTDDREAESTTGEVAVSPTYELSSLRALPAVLDGGSPTR